MKETFFISDDVKNGVRIFFVIIILFFRVSKKTHHIPLLMMPASLKEDDKNQNHKYTYQNLVLWLNILNFHFNCCNFFLFLRSLTLLYHWWGWWRAMVDIQGVIYIWKKGYIIQITHWHLSRWFWRWNCHASYHERSCKVSCCVRKRQHFLLIVFIRTKQKENTHM